MRRRAGVRQGSDWRSLGESNPCPRRERGLIRFQIVRDEMNPDQRRALYAEMAEDRPSYRTLLADLGVCEMVDKVNRNVLAEAEAEARKEAEG